MRKLLFISGSRADYNKVSRIIKFLAKSNHITVLLVDMHSDEEFGYTGRFVVEDLKDFKNVTVSNIGDCKTKRTLFYFGWLVEAVFEFVNKNNFKMTFVHGDRLSALAGAIASSYNNVPVCQIEAGDVSGNIDESIRHAITKFSENEVKKFFLKYCDKVVLQYAKNQGGYLPSVLHYLACSEDQTRFNLPCYYVFNSLTITCEGYLTCCCMDFQNYLAYANLNTTQIKKHGAIL